MIESDFISGFTEAGGSINGLRVGKTTYPIWATAGVRMKCRIDDLVIKLDSNGEGGQSNNEAALSLIVQVPDRKHFVEVIHTGIIAHRNREWRWVAQPYVEAVAHPVKPDEETFKRCQTKLKELCTRYCISDMGVFGGNWTILNGETLIYDYGFTGARDRIFKKT